MVDVVAKQANDDLIINIPRRDLLLVTALSNQVGINWLRQVSRAQFTGVPSRGQVSPELYCYRWQDGVVGELAG